MKRLVRFTTLELPRPLGTSPLFGARSALCVIPRGLCRGEASFKKVQASEDSDLKALSGEYEYLYF